VVQTSLSSQISRVDEATQEVRREVDDVKGELQAASHRLDQLTDETGGLLAARRDQDAARVRAVEEDASFDAVAALIRRGQELGVTTSNGARVAMTNGDRLRFRLVYGQAHGEERPTPMIWLNLDRPDGEDRRITAIWSPDEGFPDALVRLGEEMKRRREYPGDAIFDATALLTALVAATQLGIDLRQDPRGDEYQLDPIVEIVNAEWALTDGGLEHLSEPPYQIRPDQLLNDAHYRDHMLDKNWVRNGAAEFATAWDVAHAYYKRRPPRARRATGRPIGP